MTLGQKKTNRATTIDSPVFSPCQLCNGSCPKLAVHDLVNHELVDGDNFETN